MHLLGNYSWISAMNLFCLLNTTNLHCWGGRVTWLWGCLLLSISWIAFQGHVPAELTLRDSATDPVADVWVVAADSVVDSVVGLVVGSVVGSVVDSVVDSVANSVIDVGGELFSMQLFWLSQENPTGQYWIPLGQQLPPTGIHVLPQVTWSLEAQVEVV
jgi:hypothetical protein